MSRTLTWRSSGEGGAKPGAGGTGTLSINGRPVGTGKLARTIPFIYGVETADVGLDLYSPVTTAYAKGRQRVHGEDQEGHHRGEVAMRRRQWTRRGRRSQSTK